MVNQSQSGRNRYSKQATDPPPSLTKSIKVSRHFVLYVYIHSVGDGAFRVKGKHLSCICMQLRLILIYHTSLF
jgi:hypothetical protein